MEFDAPDWLNVSRETQDKLIAYCHQIERWNKTINLVSKSSVPLIWQRHVLDSAQIYPMGQDGLWLDIGSGGGLPGIVMAIMGAPDVILVESDQRKATFLRETVRILGLNCRVMNSRIESLPPIGAKTLSARALAPLTDLLIYAKLHLSPGGVAVFQKGRTAQDEVAEALMSWRFDCQINPSRTDPESAILVLQNIEKRKE
jgi:16S rRNA (guanine527-N7)-methyltransferase